MNSDARRIVVAYDGSEHSAAAVDWAATEAAQQQRRLVVLHVVDYWSTVPGPVVLAPWPDEEASGFDRIAREGAQRARKLAGSVVVEPLTLTGQVARTIIDASQGADHIVVGTRGHGDLAGTVLGSVSFAVSAHAPCPVVVVRGDSSEPPGPHRPVVVGADDSPGAHAAVRYAVDLAAAACAPLIIATIYRPLPPQGTTGVMFGDGLDSGSEPGTESDVHQVADQVADTAIRTATTRRPELVVRKHVVLGSTVAQLGATAQHAGLLVVGSRGRGGFAGLVLGSVSHGLIHSSPCPVAVVHGPPPQPEAPRAAAANAERPAQPSAGGGS